jgi:chorismate synthase
MDALRKSGDSAGAEVTVIARGVPVGWGEPVYDRLDADIAYAMMGINAVKGVEIGAGFRSVTQKGSEHGDELTPGGFLGNNAGGILGGISTGQDVVVRMAVKPTSSIRLPRRTINLAGEPAIVETRGGDAGAGTDRRRLAPSRPVRGRRMPDPGDSRSGSGCRLTESAPNFR